MKTIKTVTSLILVLMFALIPLSITTYAASNTYMSNSRWSTISYADAQSKYENGDKFILDICKPNCLNCQTVGTNIITPWMDNYGKTIYGVIATEGIPTFAWQYLNNNGFVTDGYFITPAILFIDGGTVIKAFTAIPDTNEINNQFYSFYSITPVTGVSLTSSAVTLTEGNTQQLTATVSPDNATNKAVTFTSSNTNVATVSETGLVTAISAGTSTIKVTTINKKVASCTVTVEAPVPETISVTGVTISPSSGTLTMGATKQLVAAVAPADATNKAVSYASSNNAVATVNKKGLVTAVSTGTATITVTTADGKKTATSVITVISDTTAVTGVTLDITATTLAVGATKQLVAAVAPADATNKAVSYASSNNAVATVDEKGLVTAVSAGTATITVKTEDGAKTAACVVTVTNEAVDEPEENLNIFQKIIRFILNLFASIFGR